MRIDPTWLLVLVVVRRDSADRRVRRTPDLPELHHQLRVLRGGDRARFNLILFGWLSFDVALPADLAPVWNTGVRQDLVKSDGQPSNAPGSP